ncbi:biorientation of chromosomes in cell division protein 1-like 1 [Anopheles bellator]|uniref:biorientation of chromosomes in cell division protein 1-like 1 n=1 Tax=Anopheles bellator TaxID=139047 RepID=UPI00264828AA|nr:biorientation of chromosomes in cell division protein 1-like 1 [Anopheles bellator]
MMVEDPHFIDAMVQELKSQGLFDQFRKECLADVDTKPAYQNLRQRVEGTVNKFLVQQEWSDNIRHKNQLREQLRKNIIDSGFLDTGVERIVDQVVNPKISTVFHPKVEEIVYNYLGIEKPKSSVNGNEVGGRSESLLEDLEAVSPDSDKKSEGSLTPPPLAPVPVEQMVEDMDIDDDDELDESKEQDDFESPAFEPLEVRSPAKVKEEETNDSISSAISGLTSQESVESDEKGDAMPAAKPAETANVSSTEERDNPATKDSEFSQDIAPINDSQLSQVSSNSQLPPTTDPSVSEELERSEENERLDITEEAQMPTLFSCSPSKKTDSCDGQNDDETGEPKPRFDFDKDGYEFVGTERPTASVGEDENSPNTNRDQEPDEESTQPTPEETKEVQQPNFSTQDDTTSLSEHSLKICEDTLSDEDTKGSRSVDARCSGEKSAVKVGNLSDASSCSSINEREVKEKHESPKEQTNEEVAKGEPEIVEEKQNERTIAEEVEQSDRKTKPETKDDHYQEHLKRQPSRQSSDTDSDGNEEKSKPQGPQVAQGDNKSGSTSSNTDATAENTGAGEENQSHTENSESVPQQSSDLDAMRGTVTPTRECGRLDSSSSGIQSGDDSEKSPESLKLSLKPIAIVRPVQPVVIDQMLTSADKSKLEQLLNGDAFTNDATLGSIQREWRLIKSQLKKPRFASNFSEARRLTKVRKKIEREGQKRLEQTLALAKRYIDDKKEYGGQMEDQGIELEFVCNDKRESPGPTISSPVPTTEDVSEPDLHYFPEPEEQFKSDERLLHYLRFKTDGVTFPRSFKIKHYRTQIFSLGPATTPARKPNKRSATPNALTSSAKIKRNSDAGSLPTVNGMAQKLKLSANDASLAMRKQRSIRNGHTHPMLSKTTPPSVGTDA